MTEHEQDKEHEGEQDQRLSEKLDRLAGTLQQPHHDDAERARRKQAAHEAERNPRRGV
ncbi:MAG TPA: hypothetical protein VHX88_09820 [Solirubrobacteraceae bacterium]|jgi:hypothetical protein|nr:hypothetical protein [Solirubrobacteraceae bacterium]